MHYGDWSALNGQWDGCKSEGWVRGFLLLNGVPYDDKKVKGLWLERVLVCEGASDAATTTSDWRWCWRIVASRCWRSWRTDAGSMTWKKKRDRWGQRMLEMHSPAEMCCLLGCLTCRCVLLVQVTWPTCWGQARADPQRLGLKHHPVSQLTGTSWPWWQNIY